MHPLKFKFIGFCITAAFFLIMSSGVGALLYLIYFIYKVNHP